MLRRVLHEVNAEGRLREVQAVEEGVEAGVVAEEVTLRPRQEKGGGGNLRAGRPAPTQTKGRFLGKG